MAKKLSPLPRRRRSSAPLQDLPGLFDNIDIDMTRDDIAGDIIRQNQHVAQAPESQSLEIDPEKLVRKSALRFISFGSGSSGNCAYIGIDRGARSTGLLIDAGVDPKLVYETLKDNKIDIDSIAGILLTHDHGDHVKYAYTILRAHRKMVLYATMRTMNGLLRRHNISRRIKDYHKAIYKEFPFEAGGFTVTAFETSHDGTDNAGFAISTPDKEHNFVVVTDTGFITDRADYYIKQANYIMLESNYDLDMLRRGPYPEYLKARITSERGHLDNAAAADYIRENYHAGLSHIFLCHLSEDNNRPELALETMRTALEARNLRIGDPANPLTAADVDIALATLPRFEASPLYILRH